MSKLDTITSLPASWRFIPLKELGDWSGGGTPSKAKPQYWQGGTIPWVSPKDMKTERISDSEDHITKDAVSHSTASLISASSVLVVTRSGILRHTLPVAVNSVPVTVNQDLKALTPRTGIMAEYVAWALRAFARDILNTCSKQGTTVNSVETAKLLRFEIPVAPTEQQRTIVAEIEKQFSRLEEAVANLKRVKANLKRYKAAVLKAAVEGKLTQDWRKQHPDVEPAGKLLDRIISECRTKWTGRGKYKEPTAPDTNNLSSLPRNWAWATVHQLAAPEPNSITDGPFGSNLETEHYRETGPRVIRLQNIGEGVFVNEEAHISEQHFARLQKHRIFADDLVIAALGEDPPRTCLIPQSVGHAIVKADCIRFKPHRDAVARYLNVVLNSEPTRQRAKSIVHGVGRPRLNLGEIKTIVVPVPPTVEQQAIVAEVERRLSVIEELEATVKANLTRADRLRQATLQQAFSGKLLLNGAHR